MNIPVSNNATEKSAQFGGEMVGPYLTKKASDEDGDVKQDYIQWMSSNNKVFFPASRNVKKLIPGFYEIVVSMNGIFFKRVAINTEQLIQFPDTNCEEVINEIEMFWDKEAEFEDAGLVFKRGILMYGPPGCHAKGSRVVMYDGSVKLVEEVEVGDLLMGPDSNPRKVLELRRGYDEMYEVTPKKGPSFIVNQHHILSLQYSGSRDRYPSPINIKLKDYLELGQPTRERLKLRRPEVIRFDAGSSLPVDPYFLGIWLGDGTARETSVTTADQEISDYIASYASSLGLQVSVQNLRNNRASTYRMSKTNGSRNVLLDNMREINVINNKHVPEAYKTSSAEERLELLAGIIDTDGSYSQVSCRPNDKVTKTGYKGYYDIIQLSDRLTQDVLWLARSLGFGTNVKKCKKSIKSSGFEGEYWRISIFGDVSRIPVKLPRKRASVGSSNKNPLLTSIKSVRHVGNDEFFGFTLSDDHLYLTDDFVVHHNSGKTCTIKMILNNIVKRGGIAIKFEDPSSFTEGMKIVREIQPETPVVCLMEDIDSILEWNSESKVINVIDGMEGIEKVVFLATTNYPEKLGSRIMNRPSRFDKRIFVGMPNAEARQIYLAKKLEGKKVAGGIEKWVEDTENMSIAHLKELVVAVTILDKPYEEVISQLREMAQKVDSRKWDNFGEGDAFAAGYAEGLKIVKADKTKAKMEKIADGGNANWVKSACKFAQVASSEETMQEAIKLLHGIGIEASYEYPGFIHFEHGGYDFAFGDANGPYMGDYAPADKIDDRTPVEKQLPSNIGPADLARWIEDSVMSVGARDQRGTAPSADPLTRLYDLDKKLKGNPAALNPQEQDEYNTLKKQHPEFYAKQESRLTKEAEPMANNRASTWISSHCKFAEKGKAVNPWAVCHTTVDKDEDPDKYERCVMDVKKKHKVKKSEEGRK